MRSASRIACSLALAMGVSAACAPDPMGTPIGGVVTDAAPDVTHDASCVPGPKPVPMDPATLPACCSGGSAHCVPSSNVDTEFAKHLPVCAGGACVPDPFITNPSYAPKPCKSVGDAAGVCLSACIPEIAKYGTILPVDVCAEGDRCAPCISPLDQKSTGSCDLGKPSTSAACTSAPPSDAGPVSTSDGSACPHAGPPVIDPATLPACGTVVGAHCLGAALVPASQTKMLAECHGGYCVPDTFIASGGNFLPTTCRAAGDVEGRCLHEALPDVARQLSSLVQDKCTPEERCVPCFDPLTGKDTGSCYLGCDIGPREPAKLYAQCCVRAGAASPLGTCIPQELVPTSQQSNLDVDTCVAGKALCVPHEQLDKTVGPSCKATGSIGGEYAGACVSACLKFDFLSSLGIAQGTCDGLHLCAPCKNPITGASTGAPGCPP